MPSPLASAVPRARALLQQPEMTVLSAEQAVASIRSGQRLFLHGGAAVPRALVAALLRREDLRDVEIVHLHTEGDAPWVAPELAGRFRARCLFVGEGVRAAVREGRADYVPVFLSEAPRLFRDHVLPIDVAVVSVSPPDRHGYCSLGTSVDIARAAIDTAKSIIAQVKTAMPRTHGDGLVDVRRATLVYADEELPTRAPRPLGEVDCAVGRNVASMIEDGATLQMGIGSLPDAVLTFLADRKRLGVHTEMFSDGLLDLFEKGVITGEEKRIHRGKIVGSFVIGSRRLYDFVDDNPEVVLLDAEYVNDPSVIRRNPKVVAINGAIEVDLTGQVCADSIGTLQYSGVGGQMDFIRGASLSPGGKPIIALPSMTKNGISRIVPVLATGAGVVTTRAHVHFVVTEHGIADLRGKSLHERAAALIKIADPRHRESLQWAARERGL